MKQTPSRYCREAQQWRAGVLARLETLDWPDVANDIRPFVENPAELAAFTPETIMAMLERRLQGDG